MNTSKTVPSELVITVAFQLQLLLPENKWTSLPMPFLRALDTVICNHDSRCRKEIRDVLEAAEKLTHQGLRRVGFCVCGDFRRVPFNFMWCILGKIGRSVVSMSPNRHLPWPSHVLRRRSGWPLA